tara:strand:+ start:71 stop:391 length:321 start_codon:yes stop_codon:yes gene_type:complete
LDGADEDSIGSGYQNTLDMISGCSSTDFGGITAAQAAINYNGGGYSDWYLPSKGELDQMYLILEDLSSTWHWSSTEYSNSHAWNKYNDWSIANKNTHYMVRPIRSF